MFAVHHPFADGAEARRFIDQAAISDEERELIAHANAERLLGPVTGLAPLGISGMWRGRPV